MKATALLILLVLVATVASAIEAPPTPSPPPTPNVPEFSFAKRARDQLVVKRISLPFFSEVMRGNILPLTLQVKNNDEAAIRNGLSITVSLPQLGIKRKIGPDSLAAKKEATKQMALPIPSHAQQGVYLARITVSSDRFHRTLYRLVHVQ